MRTNNRLSIIVFGLSLLSATSGAHEPAPNGEDPYDTGADISIPVGQTTKLECAVGELSFMNSSSKYNVEISRLPETREVYKVCAEGNLKQLARCVGDEASRHFYVVSVAKNAVTLGCTIK